MKKVTFVCLYGEWFGGMERRYGRLAEFLSINTDIAVTLITLKEAVPVFKNVGINLNKVELKVIDESFLITLLQKYDVLKKYSSYVQKIKLFLHLFFSKSDRIFFAHNPIVLYYYFVLRYKWINRYIFNVLPPLSIAAVSPHYEDYNHDTLPILSKVFSIDALSEDIANHIKRNNTEANVKTAPCSFTDYSRVVHSEKRDIDLLMVARFDNTKGHDLLEEIVPIFDDYKLVICGFGEFKPNVPNAEFTSTNDAMSLHARTKIFLSLQKKENYPSQSLLEAMASGCVVIATDVGKTRLILDESNSILINYDSTELKNAIELLMTDDKLAKQLAENAKNKVLSEFTIERYAEYFQNKVLDLQNV